MKKTVTIISSYIGIMVIILMSTLFHISGIKTKTRNVIDYNDMITTITDRFANEIKTDQIGRAHV